MNRGVAAIGAVMAAGAIAGPYFGGGPGWLTLGIVSGLVLASYILANETAGTGYAEFMRGWLIGLNAGLNGFLGFWIYQFRLGAPAGLLIATIMGLFTFLAVFTPISQSRIYRRLLGWLKWFMPMSWLAAGAGILFRWANQYLFGRTVDRRQSFRS